MPKKKTLCHWEKEEIRDKPEKYKKLIREPRYFCKRCGRAARDEDKLCRPEEI
jgi:hypothetical protein